MNKIKYTMSLTNIHCHNLWLISNNNSPLEEKMEQKHNVYGDNFEIGSSLISKYNIDNHINLYMHWPKFAA